MTHTNPIILGKLTVRYLIDGSQTDSMGLFELTVEPGAGVPPPHSHSNNEEIVYVAEGKLRYTVAGVARDLVAGESMHTPTGAVHQFSNPFSEVARALITLSPDIGAQYFLDVGEIINKAGPPDRLAMAEVMKKYGLVPAAPSAT